MANFEASQDGHCIHQKGPTDPSVLLEKSTGTYRSHILNFILALAPDDENRLRWDVY